MKMAVSGQVEVQTLFLAYSNLGSLYFMVYFSFPESLIRTV